MTDPGLSDPGSADRLPDPTQEAASPSTISIDAAVATTAADMASTADRTPDRRAFLRHLSDDAVSTAGRVAGVTSIIRRTVVGVGAAAVRGLEASAEVETPDAPALPAAPLQPAAFAFPPQPEPAPPVMPSAPTPRSQRDPVEALTSTQHELLAGAAMATMAVNDPSGPPHLTDSMFHWDGMLLRLPAQLFTARATNVDRDPRVSLLVHGANAQSWVTITGTASLVHGDQAEVETRLILAKYVAGDEVERRWAELASDGDRIVIQVRPTRFVWRLA